MSGCGWKTLLRIAVGPRSGPRLTPPPSFETQTLGFSISFTSPFQLLCCSRGVFLVLSPNPICGHMVSLLLFRWRAIIVSFHDTHLPRPKDRSPRFCFLNSIDTLFPSPILSCYWNHISCITLSCLSLYAPNLPPIFSSHSPHSMHCMICIIDFPPPLHTISHPIRFAGPSTSCLIDVSASPPIHRLVSRIPHCTTDPFVTDYRSHAPSTSAALPSRQAYPYLSYYHE